jgi:hypothetical protein
MAAASVSTQPFNYLLYDLRSGAYLGRLPFRNVQFGGGLTQPGTFSGTLDIASPGVQALNPLGITRPARTLIVVEYLGAIVWVGVIWVRAPTFEGVSRDLQITAGDLSTYFQSRQQATDYSAPPYSGLSGPGTPMAIWNAASYQGSTFDAVLMAWQVLYDALKLVSFGDLLGGLGIAANGYTTPAAYLASGTATPVADYTAATYPYSSLQQLYQIVSQLAQLGLGVGFDYGVDCAYSNGPGSQPVATVNFSTPRRGRSYAQNGLVLNCLQALNYSPPEDGSQAGNTIYEQGASGSLVVSQNLIPLQSGYPVLEQTKSRSNIQSANTLNLLTAMGISDLAISSYPVTTPAITFDLFNSPVPLGSFIVGDDARWLIPATDGVGNVFDPRFPNGLDSEWRITGYQAVVADDGQSKLTFNLALPPLLVAAAPSLV